MSWVQMTDTPGGLDVNFFDYQDLAPQGSLGDPDAGCGAEDDFFFTPVAIGLDRTVPHTIKITLDTFEGPANDVVKVYVDGVLDSVHPTPASSFTMPANTEEIQVGGLPGGGEPFIGTIDEAAIWTRALDAQEIMSVFESGLPL